MATSTSATGGHAYGYARQVGGAGGTGSGAGHVGGAGGIATGTTAKASGYSARAGAVQVGGAGGYGAGGANGGSGAATTLNNAVSGTTAGGAASYLKLVQLATGGAGGGSSAAAGGVGGAATSNLNFNDVTANTKHAANVTGTAGAYGGAGGSGITGGVGGGATATLNLTGALGVSATSNAVGGAGGIGAAGGNANATAHAVGTTLVNADATATGGSGGASAGSALAAATGQGASGDAKAASVAGSITTGSLVTAASANADATVAGASTAVTFAEIGNNTVHGPALVSEQAIALITAEPMSGDVNTILNGNANIKSAFTTNNTPTYFGIGGLGGAYSTNGSGSETETSSVHMTVDLTKVSPLHDLLIGFYNGSATGAGFSSMTLDVKVNGTDHITNFANVTDGNNFFQNHAVDYGALSGTSLQLDISLSITESAAGGYDFGMLIGDPPPQHSVAALGHATASFTQGSGANVGASAFTQHDNASPLLATPHAVT